MNAFEIGSRMTWDIVYDSWDTFPISQKWFAIGEVLAHLKYLDEEGILQKKTQNQIRSLLASLKILDSTRRDSLHLPAGRCMIAGERARDNFISF